MTRRFHITGLCCLLLCASAGCLPWLGLFGSESVGSLVGVEGNQLFYTSFVEDFFPTTSSLWALDMATGDARRLEGPSIANMLELQTEGDYFVYIPNAPEPEPNGPRIVAVQISTGKRMTVHEYGNVTTELGSVFLDNGRVAFLAGGELRILDLATETVIKTIVAPQRALAVGAFEGDQVVLVCGDFSTIDGAVLVNLATDEVLEIPAAPEGYQLAYDITWPRSMVLSGEWLVASATMESGIKTIRQSILLFHIPTQQWQVLTQSEHEISDFGSGLQPLVVWGFDGTYVLVEGPGTNGSRVELIELATGQQHVITEQSEILTSVTPILHNNQVYWLDPSSNSVIVYDIEKGSQRTIPLALTGAN